MKVIQSKCQITDDEPRWLIALISDTGLRLSEAVGLSRDDVCLDAEVPYVDIKPHSWRRLKKAGSHRKVPLVGTALWAAQQACWASQREQTSHLKGEFCITQNLKHLRPLLSHPSDIAFSQFNHSHSSIQHQLTAQT